MELKAVSNKYLTKISYDYASRGTTPPPSPHVFNPGYKPKAPVNPIPLMQRIKTKVKPLIGLGLIGGAAYGGLKLKQTLSPSENELQY
jgi:hypothetical protein